jgi:hypothetical protein
MKGGMAFLITSILVSVFILSCQAKPSETQSTTKTVETLSTTTTNSAPTSTTPETNGPITPTPSDGKYRPPQGNYACDFSLEGGIGDRLDEYYWPSSFETVQSDDFGGWKSIEFMRISDEFLPIPEDSEELKKYLDYDLNALMERRIIPEIPNGEIIHQKYLEIDTTILFAVLDLPGGSNMLINGERGDAIRGVYIVIQGAYSYVISTQITTGMFGAPESKTQEEYIQQLNQELNNFYFGIEFEKDLDVGRDFVPPPPPPAPNPADWIPDMKIPEGLFFPDKGSENFDPIVSGALMTKGDWILYKDSMYSILPVPKGWTTMETGQETYILFIPTSDPEGELGLRVRLCFEFYEDDSTTSEATIDKFLGAFTDQQIEFSLIKKEIIDADRGYVFLKVKTDWGTNRYLLEVLSRNARNLGDKFFYAFSVFTDEKVWDQYYPIIVEMVKNWHADDGVSIGIQLPDKLVK